MALFCIIYRRGKYILRCIYGSIVYGVTAYDDNIQYGTLTTNTQLFESVSDVATYTERLDGKDQKTDIGAFPHGTVMHNCRWWEQSAVAENVPAILMDAVW